MTQPASPFEALKLKHQLCFPLYAVSRLVIQAYEPMLRALGLTYPQFIVMLALWEEDGLSVTQICQRLYLDSGTVTPLLQKLKKAGLLNRYRDAKDDRVVHNALSDAGWALRPRALQEMSALFSGSGIAVQEVMQVRQSVNQLLDRLTAWRARGNSQEDAPGVANALSAVYAAPKRQAAE